MKWRPLFTSTKWTNVTKAINAEVERYQLLTEIIIKVHLLLIFVTDSSTITLVSLNLLFISFHCNATGYLTKKLAIKESQQLNRKENQFSVSLNLVKPDPSWKPHFRA